MQNTLVLKNLQMPVMLGWSSAERRQSQTVSVEITLQRITPPAGCRTDHLRDTVCYAALVKHLKEGISGREFHLLEYLAAEMFHLLKTVLPKRTKLQVSVTKYPPVEDLASGVTFSYGQLA